MIVNNYPVVAFSERCKTITHIFNKKNVYVVYYAESRKIVIEIKAIKDYFAQKYIDKLIVNVKEALYIRNDIPIEIIYTGK